MKTYSVLIACDECEAQLAVEIDFDGAEADANAYLAAELSEKYDWTIGEADNELDLCPLCNPKPKFQTGRTYTATEVYDLLGGGRLHVCPDGWTIVDTNDDYRRYDFKGNLGALTLIRVDGEKAK